MDQQLTILVHVWRWWQHNLCVRSTWLRSTCCISPTRAGSTLAGQLVNMGFDCSSPVDLICPIQSCWSALSVPGLLICFVCSSPVDLFFLSQSCCLIYFDILVLLIWVFCFSPFDTVHGARFIPVNQSRLFDYCLSFLSLVRSVGPCCILQSCCSVLSVLVLLVHVVIFFEGSFYQIVPLQPNT